MDDSPAHDRREMSNCASSLPATARFFSGCASSFRCSERTRIKWTNNLATFSPSAFGSPLFLFVEQPGEHALNGFLTHLRRGKCHTPILSFQALNSGVLALTLPGDLDCTNGQGRTVLKDVERR